MLQLSTSGRASGRRAQAKAFRIVNVPMRMLLGLPFPTPLGRRLMLVHTIGRKTGRHYRQPVSYVAEGEVLLTPGGGHWTRNLADGEAVRIQLRGRELELRPELVKDPAEIERLLGIMGQRNPALRRFVRIPSDPAGGFDRQSLEAAVQHGFRVVRWHPS